MQRKWRDRDWRPWEKPPWKQHMSSIPGLNRTRRFSVCLTVKKRVTNVEGTEEECWRDWRNQLLKLTLGLNSTRSTSVPKLINKQKKKSENARRNSLFEALSQGSWEKRVARGGGGIGGVLGKLSFLCLTTEVFHVPNFSFFTTDWESGSNFKQYSHVTNILSYQGLNMFLINSWRWCMAEYTLMSLAFIDLYIYQLFVLKRSLHNM